MPAEVPGVVAVGRPFRHRHDGEPHVAATDLEHDGASSDGTGFGGTARVWVQARPVILRIQPDERVRGRGLKVASEDAAEDDLTVPSSLMITISSPADLADLIDQHLGYSDWVEVTQDRVDLFAEATGDHQWIHVDVERAKDGPFGGTIAHGYLTLSLAPALLKDIIRWENIAMGVNYGLNKVRFPAPVPVGSKIRSARR